MTTDKAPEDYVRDTFDAYAATFDAHLVEKLEYQVPQRIAGMLKSLLQPAQKLKILDLGCGTGLFAPEIKAVADRLVGVDLSPKMVEQAAKRKLYDELVVADVGIYMQAQPSGIFDLLAALDVFIYVGKLEMAFREAARVLLPGGLLTFSIEDCQMPGQDYMLAASGRYQHTLPYIRRLTAENGFEELRCEPAQIRKEFEVPLPGYLCVCKLLNNQVSK